ncbi:Mgp12p TDEL_0E03330 [Torulaspora delbrueckii]|uniref:Glutaredoxin-like protein n=1 Tax=Torulaspora delbrueckii TaxID=4950 RepID=G8ZVD2_TORDE|nr:hypothetical protein TDEL_0E03330 [Torulaspora delbrueckii]CCE92576.1 hypothetical protein TDEL_0E03330 [Torulaspora delbrueckii]
MLDLFAWNGEIFISDKLTSGERKASYTPDRATMPSSNLVRLFHSSSRVCNYSNLNLTLFSKDNCGLCLKAKDVMNKILKDNDNLRNKANYTVVDIDDSKNKEWWDKYCFDIPVLHLEDRTKNDSLLKIFHKLDESETINKIENYK